MSSGNKQLISLLNDALPQTQCEQCGFKGCLPYAEAMAAGEALYNRCPPGGEDTLAKLTQILGQHVIPLDTSRGTHYPQARVAIIREDECIGCTKCIQACPVDAILGAAKLMHTVIADECSGCELCVAPCPVDCIDIIEVNPIPLTLEQREQRAQQYRHRYDNRNTRLARIEAEKEAKRQARRQRLANQQPSPTPQADKEQALKQAKTRYNLLHNQHKQARAALARAQKHQPGDYSAQEKLIAQLAVEAEEARAQVTALMEEAKANIAATGPSLGELKKAAATAAIALADGQTAYQAAVESNDTNAIRQWQLELTKLATANAQAQRNLEQAMQAHGLSLDS